jgi:hypothetical protein
MKGTAVCPERTAVAVKKKSSPLIINDFHRAGAVMGLHFREARLK